MASIAILTPSLTDFDPAYSLTHVILSQWRMLMRHGHKVIVYVSVNFNGDVLDGMDGIDGMDIRRVLPTLSFHSGADIALNALPMLKTMNLSRFDAIFTHDWISHPRMKPLLYALRAYACECAQTVPWYHWIHSVPSLRYEWWKFEKLPANHRLVYPNNADNAVLADEFRTTTDRIVTIPHVVDIRETFNFSGRIWGVMDALPGLLSADFTQVYPAAADRLASKGVDRLIRTFGAIKDIGYSVVLLIVDSWTGRVPRENLANYERLARQSGLDETELVFMSQVEPGFKGLHRDDLVKLMQLGNVFVFPTMGEAFGLILPEAVLAGAYPILNGALPNLRDICPDSFCADFKSWRNGSIRNDRAFYYETAKQIVQCVQKDVAMRNRDHIRKTYNMDRIYKDYYEPLLQGQGSCQSLPYSTEESHENSRRSTRMV